MDAFDPQEAVHERRMAAVEILTLAAPRLTPADLTTVERLLREAGTWALVDGLAGNVAGGIALRDPRSWPLIDAWAVDGDFWVRRSAVIPPPAAGAAGGTRPAGPAAGRCG